MPRPLFELTAELTATALVTDQQCSRLTVGVVCLACVRCSQGIGMKLEDALLFWRTEFTKAMGADKFEKSYAYNIRHNYGKEGKRTDYTPYSCMKIIMSSAPAAGDAHGCPFRHSDIDTLRMRMHSYKVPPRRALLGPFCTAC